jgi:hypothetical protein
MRRVTSVLVVVAVGLAILAVIGFAVLRAAVERDRDVQPGTQLRVLETTTKGLPIGLRVYWLGSSSPLTITPQGQGVSRHPEAEMVFQLYSDDGYKVPVVVATQFGQTAPYGTCCSTPGGLLGAWARPHGETVLVFVSPDARTDALRVSVGRHLTAYRPD